MKSISVAAFLSILEIGDAKRARGEDSTTNDEKRNGEMLLTLGIFAAEGKRECLCPGL